MENEFLKSTVKDLVDRFGGHFQTSFGQPQVILPSENLVEAAKALRDKHGFELLAGLSAVDYWPELAPRFHVVYQFNSHSKLMRLEVRVPLGGNDPVIDTLTDVYPNANWFERELWDMFGIRAKGHPDLRRILMPFDWEGHPLRKDYPLGYEEVQFSFNYDEIEKRKPRPTE